MPNLNIAIVGCLNYAKNFGKKSTETDITFYDTKRGETTLSILEPSRYPEKLSSLFYAATFADYTIFVIEKIDRYLNGIPFRFLHWDVETSAPTERVSQYTVLS